MWYCLFLAILQDEIQDFSSVLNLALLGVTLLVATVKTLQGISLSPPPLHPPRTETNCLRGQGEPWKLGKLSRD